MELIQKDQINTSQRFADFDVIPYPKLHPIPKALLWLAECSISNGSLGRLLDLRGLLKLIDQYVTAKIKGIRSVNADTALGTILGAEHTAAAACHGCMAAVGQVGPVAEALPGPADNGILAGWNSVPVYSGRTFRRRSWLACCRNTCGRCGRRRRMLR